MNYIRVVRMRRSRGGRVSLLPFASVSEMQADVRSTFDARAVRVTVSGSVASKANDTESLGVPMMPGANKETGISKTLTGPREVVDAAWRFLRLMVLIPWDAIRHPLTESVIDYERGTILARTAKDERT